MTCIEFLQLLYLQAILVDGDGLIKCFIMATFFPGMSVLLQNQWWFWGGPPKAFGAVRSSPFSATDR